MKRFILAMTTFITFTYCQEFENSRVCPIPDLTFIPEVLTGLDVLQEIGFEPIIGKNLAILTNQTAVNQKGIHLLDLIAPLKDSLDVKIIFSPEFGFFPNEVENIGIIEENRDSHFGAEIKSLWGKKYQPDPKDFKEVDLVLIDIQDIGVRYSSFMTTVTKVMEVAAFTQIPVIILDRPNPLNGVTIDGPTVRPEYQSFVGYHFVPIRHGLTIGEYAIMVNEMGWIRKSRKANLTVIPLVNWERNMWFDETGLMWVPPTDYIPDLNSLLAYVGMGLLEGTNITAGKGTKYPYLLVGAPWISGDALFRSLQQIELPGVRFSSVIFVPQSYSPSVVDVPYQREECSGVKLTITDRKSFSPLKTAVTILTNIVQHYPNEFQWIEGNYIDKLFGYNYLRIFIAQRRDPQKLPATWTHDTIKFHQLRKEFLLY